ncbi:MAG TPA: hypothetical protein VEF04_22710, partial [Blastocatellia bacterium]|nr:hypothetical protein [Blastocatellia bacterium]
VSIDLSSPAAWLDVFDHQIPAVNQPLFFVQAIVPSDATIQDTVSPCGSRCDMAANCPPPKKQRVTHYLFHERRSRSSKLQPWIHPVSISNDQATEDMKDLDCQFTIGCDAKMHENRRVMCLALSKKKRTFKDAFQSDEVPHLDWRLPMTREPLYDDEKTDQSFGSNKAERRRRRDVKQTPIKNREDDEESEDSFVF